MISRIADDELFRKLPKVNDNLFVSNYGRLYSKLDDKIITPIKLNNVAHYKLKGFNYAYSKISMYDLSNLVWKKAELKIEDLKVTKTLMRKKKLSPMHSHYCVTCEEFINPKKENHFSLKGLMLICINISIIFFLSGFIILILFFPLLMIWFIVLLITYGFLVILILFNYIFNYQACPICGSVAMIPKKSRRAQEVIRQERLK
jgi:hypothetical protein